VDNSQLKKTLAAQGGRQWHPAGRG